MGHRRSVGLPPWAGGAVNERIRKYDAIAESYSSRYADPLAVARFYVRLVASWGMAVPDGASVLELGCADGFLTEALVRRGYRVTAVDISPKMIDVARRRLQAARLDADLRVADVEGFSPDSTWDVLLGAMWTLYAYVGDPAAMLARLAPSIGTKAIIDVNPRTHQLDEALREMRTSGFPETAWRPVFVPLTRKVGRAGLGFLATAGRIPPVRDAILRRKFNAAVLGLRG
jgi:SAM-dependent methyltransferase